MFLPRRAFLALLATVGLVAGVPLSAHARDDAAVVCVDEGNVWVLVQADDVVKGGCATEFEAGFEALESAGFTATVKDGFLRKIDGMPVDPGREDWWSYWNNTPGANGTFAGWKSYEVGAADARPVAGSVEGWRLAHSFTATAPAPGDDPVAGHKLAAIIVTDPSDQSVTAGQQATFAVEVSGDDVTVLWQREVDGTWENIPGATGVSYGVVGDMALDRARFRAVASSERGAMNSEAATLSVAPAPLPTIQPSASASVSAPGSTDPSPAPVRPGLPHTGR